MNQNNLKINNDLTYDNFIDSIIDEIIVETKNLSDALFVENYELATKYRDNIEKLINLSVSLLTPINQEEKDKIEKTKLMIKQESNYILNEFLKLKN